MKISEKIEKLVVDILKKRNNIINKDIYYYREYFKDFVDEEINLIKYSKGEYLTTLGGEVDKILIHLSGDVSVYKFGYTGVSVRNGISKAPEIYGLYESLISIPEYVVTLEAKEDVIAIIISPRVFMESINKNHNLALYSLIFLANFTDKLLSRNNRLTLNSRQENLALYFLDEIKSSSLPHVVKSSKVEIAENINVSIRTLYRLLDKFNKENFIHRVGGNIIISDENKMKLQNFIKSFNL